MRKVVHASATTALIHSIQWHEGNPKLVIDYEIYDLKWPEYIGKLITKKATRDQFGIMFAKRQSAVENQNIEKIYFKS